MERRDSLVYEDMLKYMDCGYLPVAVVVRDGFVYLRWFAVAEWSPIRDTVDGQMTEAAVELLVQTTVATRISAPNG